MTPTAPIHIPETVPNGLPIHTDTTHRNHTRIGPRHATHRTPTTETITDAIIMTSTTFTIALLTAIAIAALITIP